MKIQGTALATSLLALAVASCGAHDGPAPESEARPPAPASSPSPDVMDDVSSRVLAARTVYPWRVRILHDRIETPYLRHSRWFTRPNGGWNQPMLRTP